MRGAVRWKGKHLTKIGLFGGVEAEPSLRFKVMVNSSANEE